ncbi:DUF4235 domain-containing protein [Streptomyces goshikiensis]|uniref:DUF4235 domain-containing protein n=1 Tax=Streptomyces goshikiensis TaxID=1942 RepID=UPI0036BB413F
MQASKIAYKPVGVALGAVSGVIAGAAFKQAWRSSKAKAMLPTRPRTGLEADPSGAMQGAIFAVVKASVDWPGAVAIRRLTGTRPG